LTPIILDQHLIGITVGTSNALLCCCSSFSNDDQFFEENGELKAFIKKLRNNH